EINLLRALWFGQQNKLVEASAMLKPLVGKYPLAAVQRMRIDITLKDQQAGEQDALAVREFMQSGVSKGTALSSEEYQDWAIAEELLGSNARMRAVLTDWLKIDPNNTAARQDLGAVTLREFIDQIRSPQPNPEQLARQLSTAFELSTNPEPLKQQLVD